MTLGYRLRLHFDGYSDSHDVWLNADSENLFPVGWCEKNGQKLRPPKNYVMPNSSTGNLDSTHTSQSPSQQPTTNPPLRTFTWPQYLKFTGSAAAPRHLFVSTQNDVTILSMLSHNKRKLSWWFSLFSLHCQAPSECG